MTLLTTSNALSPGALETIWSRRITRCIFDTSNLPDSPADNIEIDQRSIACMVARTFESGRCDITVVLSLANPPSPSFHTSWETRSFNGRPAYARCGPLEFQMPTYHEQTNCCAFNKVCMQWYSCVLRAVLESCLSSKVGMYPLSLWFSLKTLL